MYRSGILALCVAMLAVGACGNSGSAPTGEQPAAGGGAPADAEHSLPGNAEAGAAIYGRICVACHGADGRGNGGVTGANFVGDATRLAKTNTQLLLSIRDGVTTGPSPMPAQAGVLNDQEMKDVLSYIRHTFGHTAQ